ncbi:MAG: hypothetical protein MAG794_01612 [Gammaproteobacteria bacterium]|nr:hypothetical protein [Gammaproteobacteria bacterium]
MNYYVVPFAIALILFCGLFVELDLLVMKAQGLSLLFHQ